MNKIVDAQREQVQTFKAVRDEVKQTSDSHGKQLSKISQDSDSHGKQLSKISQDLDHQTLKYQAFRQCHNIVITGLAEHETLSAYAVARNFFKTELKIKNLDIDAAHRVGQHTPENTSYSRPIIVSFNRLSDRNAVWRKRNDIPQTDGQQRIKIQADLPRQLREDIPTLYKVAKAASATHLYKSVYVKEYALFLDGKEYTAKQLETLPVPLRPSSLATQKTDTALVFFSKHCALSNHFPLIFTYQDNTFYNMEHYLAFRRAEISQKQFFIKKALELRDPVEAKSILNTLKKDHEEDWQKNRYEITATGIGAKFTQNKHLSNYLRATENLLLGEDSKDPCWGYWYDA